MVRGGHDGSQGDQTPGGSTTGVTASLGNCTIGVVPPPPWYNHGVIDARAKIEWAKHCRSLAAEEGADETGDYSSPPVSEPNSDLAATPPAPCYTSTTERVLKPTREGKTTWDRVTGRWTWMSTALRDRGVEPRSTTDAINALHRDLSARISSLTALALSFEVKRRKDRIVDQITRAYPPVSWSEARTVEEAPPPRL